jgi:hypothetical protein
LKDPDTALSVDVTSWTFRSHIRNRRTDTVELAELTSGNGGWVVIDGPSGIIQMVLSKVVTDELVEGTLEFDVVKTNDPDNPVWLFSGSFKCRKPVTRD